MVLYTIIMSLKFYKNKRTTRPLHVKRVYLTTFAAYNKQYSFRKFLSIFNFNFFWRGLRLVTLFYIFYAFYIYIIYLPIWWYHANPFCRSLFCWCTLPQQPCTLSGIITSLFKPLQGFFSAMFKIIWKSYVARLRIITLFLIKIKLLLQINSTDVVSY